MSSPQPETDPATPRPASEDIPLENAATSTAPPASEGPQPASGGGDDELRQDLDEVQQALADTESELASHRDAMLRMQAEMENLRKRLTRDLERSRRFALEGILRDLLQVRDSLERGLETTGGETSAEQLREGGQLTLKMLNKVMGDHGLEVIDPQGEPFNPEWHEAMAMQPSAEHADNAVLEVLQKGFKLHDRLIRPARVVVSRKP